MTYIPMKRKNHYVAMQYDIQTPTEDFLRFPCIITMWYHQGQSELDQESTVNWTLS